MVPRPTPKSPTHVALRRHHRLRVRHRALPNRPPHHHPARQPHRPRPRRHHRTHRRHLPPVAPPSAALLAHTDEFAAYPAFLTAPSYVNSSPVGAAGSPIAHAPATLS